MAPTSTARVAKHRAKLRATKGGAELITRRGRHESKRYYLKVKRLKSEIASYEQLLGIEPDIQTTTAKVKRHTHLPPKEELRRMTMADLAEWKRQRRIDYRRQSSRTRGKEESIKSLQATLGCLTKMERRKRSRAQRTTPAGPGAPQPSPHGSTEEGNATGSDARRPSSPSDDYAAAAVVAIDTATTEQEIETIHCFLARSLQSSPLLPSSSSLGAARPVVVAHVHPTHNLATLAAVASVFGSQ